jgi:hypothetical protein
MPETDAQRQATYRRGRSMAGSCGDSRLNTWVSTSAHLALERLARHDGVTQRAMLERLIKTQDDLVLASLNSTHDRAVCAAQPVHTPGSPACERGGLVGHLRFRRAWVTDRFRTEVFEILQINHGERELSIHQRK